MFKVVQVGYIVLEQHGVDFLGELVFIKILFDG